jgi:hypothetical protein
MLLSLLRDQQSLLMLDNFETVLEPGQQEGRYRDGFAGYGALLQAIAETRDQSCLVVTSREAPPELAVLSGGAVRRLQLSGLGVPEGQVLLADKRRLFARTAERPPLRTRRHHGPDGHHGRAAAGSNRPRGSGSVGTAAAPSVPVRDATAGGAPERARSTAD